MDTNGIKPNDVSVVSAFLACGQLGCLENGEEIYEIMRKYGIVCNIMFAHACLDMHVKCGCIDMAETLFKGMPQRNISIHCKHGEWKGIGYVFKDAKRSETKPCHLYGNFICI
ncbi:hypothetical protein EV1_009138 [Malus domestica]